MQIIKLYLWFILSAHLTVIHLDLSHILSLKHFFSFFFFSPFSDAVEHLRDHVEELGDIGADNRDLDFLRQIFEDPTLLKVVDVSDSFSPL